MFFAMQKVELELVKHSVKIGDSCERLEPNICEDTIFTIDGTPIGFYVADIGKYSEKAAKFAAIANAEFLSKRVPKSTMKRSSGLFNKENEVLQYSTILGGVPPKPHMRRYYKTMSSVHTVASAAMFIKAMLLLCREAEDIIRTVTPEIYEKQADIIESQVEENWRFGRLFTSSISNFNIAADYHKDAANIKDTVNVIIAKRDMSRGGHTNVPDYGATVNSCDNSMLVYPAWRNVHGVTPIEPTAVGGYRNTLVFYPLKAFLKG